MYAVVQNTKYRDIHQNAAVKQHVISLNREVSGSLLSLVPLIFWCLFHHNYYLWFHICRRCTRLCFARLKCKFLLIFNTNVIKLSKVWFSCNNDSFGNRKRKLGLLFVSPANGERENFLVSPLANISVVIRNISILSFWHSLHQTIPTRWEFWSLQHFCFCYQWTRHTWWMARKLQTTVRLLFPTKLLEEQSCATNTLVRTLQLTRPSRNLTKSFPKSWISWSNCCNLHPVSS